MTVDVLDGAQGLEETPRRGRGGVPAPEPLVLIEGGPAVDQAVFDAEFVALVMAEQPWGEERPAPRATPPRRGPRARREPPPRSSRGVSAGGDLPRLGTARARGGRRRPVPRTRAPPVHPPATTVSTRR
ncbi:hypothetical protein [Actinomycetospora chibensis]|uniref:Uncharacterized protein n=1 Tax=Actinomycetospora chibensis TaxID=663606 RepID=A0ABV9RQG0_9PSEU|nr:hypothetical protein [Actinomycetospora chibensis]MDD7925355.1 hypothetical protein [Actinomycetospora chibensis]